jgi:hypothetical protein
MNLGHYLSSAIIAPANYIKNRNQDLQNRFENNVLLCSRKFTNESNCSLEIVFNQKEEEPEKISENFFVYHMPLPISRIKAIHFSDEQQKTNTVFDITSGAAFVPHKLLRVSNDQPINTSEIDHVKVKSTEVEWSHYLKKFDQFLGGFALMKIGKEDFQNYPSHYFKSLGNINKFFDKVLIDQGIDLENKFQFAFTNNGKFKAFHDTIYSDVSGQTLSKYASKDNIKIESRNGLVLIDKIPENTQSYIIAILDIYGPDKRKQIDSFISDLVSEKFNSKRKEGLALTFGINKGYSVFRNKYKTENFEANIKFELNSKLDYYIIESIYQNVFNSQDDTDNFAFIDSWCPTLDEQKVSTTSFDSYKVLDKTIIFKKKEDFFYELFLSSLGKRNRLFEVITKHISQSLPKFLSIDRNQLKQDLQSEFEMSAHEYAEFIFDQTSKKVNDEHESIKSTLETKLSELKKTLASKEDEIKKLQDKLNQQQLSDINSTKENKIEKESKIEVKEEVNIGINEPIEKYNPSPSGFLFNEENPELKKKKREKELRSFKVPELKEIGKTLKISNASSLKKDELVTIILEKEF